jgi:hypothetical protein
MAQRIITEGSCDWHEKLNTPVKVPAVGLRITPVDKEIDLCASCCILFDLAMPRLQVMIEFFNPEVIERLLRTGRKPEEPEGSKRSRVPAQLAIPGSSATPKRETKKRETAKPETAKPEPPNTRKAALANRGCWKPDVDQVLCTLDHKGANSPKQYWVDVRNRGSHAKSSHEGLLGPQIPYELPPDAGFTLDVKCFDHKVCAEAGGFGFKNAAGLAMHITKADAEGWEPAPKDAAATPAA